MEIQPTTATRTATDMSPHKALPARRGGLGQLRILPYPPRLAPTDEDRIRQDDADMIWLNKN